MDARDAVVDNSTPLAPQTMLTRHEGPSLQTILLMIMLSVFAFVGSVGNGMVVFVFQRVRDKSTAQLFIVFMAMIDLFTCMIIIPMTAFAEYTEYRIKSDLLCKIYHFLITSKVPLSLFVMVAIAVDRYMCICRPLQRAITRTKAKVIIAALVLLAFTLGAFSVLFHGMYQAFYMLDLKKIDQEAGTNFSHSPPFFSSRDILFTLHMKNYSFPDCAEAFPPEDVMSASNMRVMCELQSLPQLRQMVNVEVCDRSFIHLSEDMFLLYQNAYNCIFPLCLILVLILYSFIYRFMCKRRARKLREKLILCSYVNGDGTFENTHLASTPPDIDRHEGDRPLKECLVLDTTDKHTHLTSNEIAKPTSISQIVCLEEDNGTEKHLLGGKTTGENKSVLSTPVPGQTSSLIQPMIPLNHPEAARKLSRSELLVSDAEVKYGYNLMTDQTHTLKTLSSQSLTLNSFSSTPDINKPGHDTTELYHPIDDIYLLQPLHPHTNNNNSMDRSLISETIDSHDFASETNSGKYDLFNEENGSHSDVNSPRRSSHCHPKQKYQWHKNRDSMRRHKGKGRGERQPRAQRDDSSRRRSPHSLEAERLSNENRRANVRTALMLFTVTIMFIVAYTPGWMMTMRFVPHNKLVFFVYFSYNVANPFIYAFMNHVFKRFMCRVLTCKNSHQSRI
ncbi:cholecystokinin receptor type A [Elysia marginata]|uniref:Cholecystokinin receptor type A n=1 Tax=Elysia marginata TaxID=1093978 RepID=A0AAV4GGP0_9GAST|nr:cholecystokinin receptor type A [Elysia marginata]